MTDWRRRKRPLDDEFLPIERRLLEASAGGPRGFLLLRLILSAVLLLQTLRFTDEVWSWTWISVLPALYAAAAIFIYRLRADGKLGDDLSPATFLIDVGASVAVLRATSGPGPDSYIALLLLILGACFLRKPLFMFMTSMCVCLVYGWMAFPSSTNLTRDAPIHLALFLLITLFGVHIADYARAVEQETARRYEERLAWMQRLSLVGKGMAAVLHEAKTPIGTIVLNAEAAIDMLAKGKPPDAELRVIGEQADHATAILQNFLDFVKPTQLDRKPIEAREPLLQALDMLRVRLDERAVAVDLKTIDGCSIAGSARHLQQAFANVINNAIDAMPSGGKLAIGMTRRGGSVAFTFEDTGAGMSEEALRRVFEPFATSKEDDGHGLGLGIVLWIAHEHDGELSVDSSGPGRGTRVELTLPAASKS